VISAAKGDIAKTKAIEELFGKGIETGALSMATTASTYNPQQQKNLERIKNENNFIFELKRCERSGRMVTCSFLITNKNEDDDRDLFINGGISRLFDDSGKEYVPSKVQLGNDETRFGLSLYKKMPFNVPVEASLIFEKVSTHTSKIALLEIDCSFRGGFRVQFHNIPLSR